MGTRRDCVHKIEISQLWQSKFRSDDIRMGKVSKSIVFTKFVRHNAECFFSRNFY